VASSMALASKAKYFTLAAAVLLAVAVLGIGRTIFDSAKYKTQGDMRRKIETVVRDAEDARSKLADEQGRELESEGVIENAYKPFEYRQIVPKVIETVLSVFPNEHNNQKQRQVYEAFERGDIATLMETPRKERKQIFVTSMSVYYTPDVESARFGQAKMRQVGSSAPRRSGGGASSLSEYDRLTMESMGISIEEETTSGRGTTERAGGEAGGPGFVVMLTGYTPYKNIGEMMDPAGVGDDREKWGVVTRLMNLSALEEPNSVSDANSLSDANCPSDANGLFELYKKTDIVHFELQTGDVSLDGQMPDGIGMVKDVKQGDSGFEERVLIDPMTKEVISKLPLKDEMGRDRLDNKGKRVYQVADHWFVLKFKLRWRQAPASESTEGV
jgi:type IV pilus assembly protein PilM